MIYKVSKPTQPIEGRIILPSSKSICNRLQIIRALCSQDFKIDNFSDSDDTQVLKKSLENINIEEINIGHAGTAMRFLTAYLSVTEGEFVLTGSERMKNRPIGVLVDALRDLGAEIEYIEKEGFPPLKIKGKRLDGGSIKISADISSQYISALMMIAPTMKNPLTIELEGKILSAEYIRMTLELMKLCGVAHVWNKNKITISNTPYSSYDFFVESDWSAAAFWYEIVALNKNSKIELVGLSEDSLQGDSALPVVFENIGIKTTFTEQGIIIENTEPTESSYHYDFINQPDLAQAVVVTLVCEGIPFKIEGLDNLRIKETDRIAALKIELGKYGFLLDDTIENSLILTNKPSLRSEDIEDVIIETYQDHRMAMAFAPLAFKYGSVNIKDPNVVNKSYPGFWEDLMKVGFKIERV